MVRKLGVDGAIAELRTYHDYPGYDYYTMGSDRINIYDKEITHEGQPNSRNVGADCSSFVYTYLSLVFGKTMNVGNTETLYNDLVKLGYQHISSNEDWDAKKGDIFIWSTAGKGTSAGANGHTGVFINDKLMLNSNYGHDGIYIDDYNEIWQLITPYVDVYRKVS